LELSRERLTTSERDDDDRWAGSLRLVRDRLGDSHASMAVRRHEHAEPCATGKVAWYAFGDAVPEEEDQPHRRE
jgi:hypothetical protein